MSSTSSVHPQSGALPVVLLVDDSSTIRTTAKIFLKPFAGRICLEFAQDGFEALRAVGQVNPSLIIADVLMPRLSGYQFCQMVKQSPAHKKTPLYILSSRDGGVDKALGAQSGADGYLVKPFNAAVLASLMNSVFGLELDPVAA